MSTAFHAVSIPRLSAAVLVAAVLVLPGQGLAQERGAGQTRGLGLGVDVDLGGIKADVDATVSGEKGLVDANATANVGGERGVNADAKANVAGSKGLVDADVTASIGGRDGVTADIDANVGGSRGLVDANVNAGVGGSRGLNANVGANVGGDSTGSGGAAAGNGQNEEMLRRFSELPSSERLQMIRRCGGINGAGYDAALANLCRLLETASR